MDGVVGLYFNSMQHMILTCLGDVEFTIKAGAGHSSEVSFISSVMFSRFTMAILKPPLMEVAKHPPNISNTANR